MGFRLLFALLFVTYFGMGQAKDSSVVTTANQPPAAKTDLHKHSPTKATILSAVLPGAGQVYNKKNWWWKVPVIYGAGAGLVYGYVFYNNGFKDFDAAYKYRINTPSEVNGDPYYDKYQTPTLRSIRDSYKQARDQCAIFLVILYAVQILDATVEAHLLEFDVNDDLSLNVQPVYVPYGNYAYSGVQFNFRLK